MITIVHISPVFRTKGGISTVVKNYLGATGFEKHKLLVVDTHGEGGAAQKARMALGAFVKSIQVSLFEKPSIIHVHIGDFPSIYRKMIVSFPFLFRRKTKKILHFHGAAFVEQYADQNDFLKKLIGLYFKQFDRVICLSETWEALLSEELNVQNTVVVHNAVPAADQVVALSDDAGALRLLFLGLIGDRKGLFDLIEAMKILIADGYKIHLTVGGNGDVETLKAYMREPALKDAITYLGWVNDAQKEEAFLTSDVFVLPSYAEGMPMSVLEAMSYGLPVVSTNVGGIPELVQHERSGILIEAGDVEALRVSLARLSDDPALKKQMGAASRQVFMDGFSLDQHVEQVDGIYQDVLNERV